MKKLLVTLAAVLVSVSSYAQGTLAFSTFVSGQVNAPTYAPGQMASNGAGAGTLGTVNAQLFLVTGGPYVAGGTYTLTPLTPATTYITSGTGRHVAVPASSVVVPGRAAGETATIILRAWQGASYDAAVAGGGAYGQTPFGGAATVTLGGQPASGPALTPGNLVGLQGFELVPEPSTLAFGLLGAAALLYRRRK
jgi:hypothetical protein